MVDEHFGINVVEFMVWSVAYRLTLLGANKYIKAAGAIPVAHASGGPLKDIVVPVDGKRTGRSPHHNVTGFGKLMFLWPGYHAGSPREFSDAFHSILQLSGEKDLALRRRARKWAVERFSNEEFEKGWDNSRWKDWL